MVINWVENQLGETKLKNIAQNINDQINVQKNPVVQDELPWAVSSESEI